MGHLAAQAMPRRIIGWTCGSEKLAYACPCIHTNDLKVWPNPNGRLASLRGNPQQRVNVAPDDLLKDVV
jgi:hypothetical protein